MKRVIVVATAALLLVTTRVIQDFGKLLSLESAFPLFGDPREQIAVWSPVFGGHAPRPAAASPSAPSAGSTASG
jgi:hypothetical protein